MADIARKLHIKEGTRVRVLNAPPGIELDFAMAEAQDADAILVFVKNRDELTTYGTAAIEAGRADRLAWIAYPKAGQLGTDLNRDILWQLVDDQGIRPVRQVSIDDVWSALRFRPGSLSRQ